MIGLFSVFVLLKICDVFFSLEFVKWPVYTPTRLHCLFVIFLMWIGNYLIVNMFNYI